MSAQSITFYRYYICFAENLSVAVVVNANILILSLIHISALADPVLMSQLFWYPWTNHLIKSLIRP